jgi:hypothetical protein
MAGVIIVLNMVVSVVVRTKNTAHPLSQARVLVVIDFDMIRRDRGIKKYAPIGL